MGMIYQRKYRRADGTVVKAATWTLKYYRNGRPIRESTGLTKEGEARRLLKVREGDIERGVPISPRVGRVTFDEMAEQVTNDYRANGKRSLPDVERRISNHLKPFFGGRRMATIVTGDAQRYTVTRQSEQAGNATINRELSVLKRAFALGIRSGVLLMKPYIPMLDERDNVRTGFFEPDQFGAVRAHLPEPLRPVVTFAYITGWRVPSEVLRLQWRHVDFAAGTVRLDPGTTKNRKGRVFPFTAELRALLETQRERTHALERAHGALIPWVFHREGKAIKSFYGAWRTACKKAGCPGRIPHDFRRTAVRNSVRAGVPERVAMELSGHKTRAVFERYNIVSEADLTDAARRLDHVARTPADSAHPETVGGSR